MRVVAVVAVLILVTLFAPAPAAAQKIAIVDSQRVLWETAEGKAEQAKLEKKFTPKEQELKNRNAQLEKLQSELQQKGASMPQAEQQRRAAEIQRLQTALTRDTEDARTEFNNEQQDVVGRLAKRVDDVVHKFGTDNGYHLILDAGQAGTLFAGPSADITNEIIAAYNKAYPLGAAPAAAPPAAKKP